jgi:hypothetical protein
MPTLLYAGAELIVENRGGSFVNRRHDTQVDARSSALRRRRRIRASLHRWFGVRY